LLCGEKRVYKLFTLAQGRINDRKFLQAHFISPLLGILDIFDDAKLDKKSGLLFPVNPLSLFCHLCRENRDLPEIIRLLLAKLLSIGLFYSCILF
jgi:hypothetical protein